MKSLDRFIQKFRIQKAAKYIPPNARILDIGCADGMLFQILSGKFREGIGVDPGIQSSFKRDHFQLIRGNFPEDIPSADTFDAVTLLAVLEHIPFNQQATLAKNIFERLNAQGILIISVPSPRVDVILKILRLLRLIDGMSLEEHYGFDVKTVKDTFVRYGFELTRHEKFQFGLNNLFVFKKP